MERDFDEGVTNLGYSFSVPYFYDGIGFAGHPHFVQCADSLHSHALYNCSGLKICTNRLFYSVLSQNLFPNDVLVPVDILDFATMYFNGTCNVVSHEKTVLVGMKRILRTIYKNTDPFMIGNNTFSKEPLAIVTREDDPEWSDFVNYVLQALWVAERDNITQSTADLFGNTSLFANPKMFQNAIRAVSNYAELFDRHYRGFLDSRHGLNLLYATTNNDDDNNNTNGESYSSPSSQIGGGLIYALPFGDISKNGTNLIPDGGTLQTILNRGRLICGIQPDRKGFAEYNNETQQWTGMDADYCRALSASIFGLPTCQNTTTTTNNGSSFFIEFVKLPNTNNNYKEFEALANITVDVLAGGKLTPLSDVLIPEIGEGFSFSQPYFYDDISSETGRKNDIKRIALATRQDDPHWSKFVFWIVASTFYAQETRITQERYMEMPIVNLLGPEFQFMFQHAIHAIGNYNEIYTRNFDWKISHKGQQQLNKLNEVPHGAQHFAVIKEDLTNKPAR